MDKNSVKTLRQKLALNRPALIAGDYIEAGVLMAITADAEAADCIPEIILTRRAAHLSLHPGEAAFPGGKQDPTDKSLLATALREAHEEVALKPQQVEYLGALDQRITRSGIRVSPFVGIVPADYILTPNQDELDCIYKVPLSFFSDASNVQWIEQEYRGA
ncbi:NUDIX hydrolase [Oceanicoccus sagamiensis]|uniref:Nudix hydrolase domain-containing protein n=1 Tax=Oceanicoccus sagamiensis TaxID=716816 RepID=A0A1X9NQF0_9GAMM|nr:CoA pyrophosphatase [Oceanicoccus sagamiensis]ARN76053.1 hypothetical protein BST96_19300 [Oceanicoccus sagamiensis]